jgi:hypothetical protein
VPDLPSFKIRSLKPNLPDLPPLKFDNPGVTVSITVVWPEQGIAEVPDLLHL